MIISGGNGFQGATSKLSTYSTVLCSKEDESRYLKGMNDQNRRERIKQVREHENEASRLML